MNNVIYNISIINIYYCSQFRNNELAQRRCLILNSGSLHNKDVIYISLYKTLCYVILN